MHIPGRGWAGAMLVCAVSVGGETAPSTACPPGTEARTEEAGSPASRQQVCVDPQSGMKEGPTILWQDNGKKAAEGTYLHDKMHGKSRMYGQDGELLVEVEYDQDEVKSGHLTAAGLRAMLGGLQTQASMHSVPISDVSVPEDWTIRYDVMALKPDLPQELLAYRAAETRTMACEIFQSPFDNDFVVQVREVTGDGKVISEKKLTRKDCAATP